MRSKANFKGHPIHPMLIPFPFAFLVGGVGFDVAGIVTGNVSWWVTGGYLTVAGIVAALVAAVPGLIDYFWTVPPNSSAKKRATLHLTVNLIAVAIFAIALWWRGGPSLPPSGVTLALQLVALALLSSGGWMGGTLVSRNQIGVDGRYANAGKWREASFDAPNGTPIPVARVDELQPDQMKLLRLGGHRVVLARTSKAYVAFDDRCKHKGGSLAGGALVCGVVQCPWHGSQFDVATGAVMSGPAKEGIATYQVEVRDGEVFVSAHSAPSASTDEEAEMAAGSADAGETVAPPGGQRPSQPRRARRRRVT